MLLFWALAAVLTGGTLLMPHFPFSDAALFEFYGRAIVRGAHLYRDVSDVKPPSIYYVNALWQWLFPENYVVHNWAAAVVNGGSIILFTSLARTLHAPAWRTGTLLFSVPLCAVTSFDSVQHYAVFFILLGYLLAFRGLSLLGGSAIAVAATFWLPAALLLVPILRWRVVGGFVMGSVGYYLAFSTQLGPAWPTEMIALWPRNLQVVADAGRFADFVTSSGGAFVIALLLLACSTVRAPKERADRFTITWSLCALLCGAIPPRFFPVYFLPAVPALAMLIATSGVARARRAVGAVAVVVVLYAAALRFQEVGQESRYASIATQLGAWIEGSIGPHRVLWTNDYLPEAYLAADATPAGPDVMVLDDLRRGPRGLELAGARLAPDVVVLGSEDRSIAPQISNLTLGGIYYTRICAQLGPVKFTLLTFPEFVARFRC